MRVRCSSAGRRSAWTYGVHQGETGGKGKKSGTGWLFHARDWQFCRICAIGGADTRIKGVWIVDLPLH